MRSASKEINEMTLQLVVTTILLIRHEYIELHPSLIIRQDYQTARVTESHLSGVIAEKRLTLSQETKINEVGAEREKSGVFNRL